MSKEFDYDAFPWGDYFKLDETSPTGLAWNTISYSGNGKLELWVGKPAGSITSSKEYTTYRVSFKYGSGRKSVAVSRIIASLNGLKINGKVVDHLNGIPTDNRIENLRVTTQAVNTRNKRVQTNSNYGISGVTCRTVQGSSYFIGQFVRNGKNTSRHFSIDKLGVMEAFKRAVVHRQNGIANANLEGLGYSQRHCSTDGIEQSLAITDISVVPKTKQMRNTRKRKTNKSGYTGVCWSVNSQGITNAIASWVDWSSGSPKYISKFFSTNKYGLLPAFAMAVKSREDAIKMLNKNGHGYSENHGK